jgi:hypothetical protein
MALVPLVGGSYTLLKAALSPRVPLTPPRSVCFKFRAMGWAHSPIFKANVCFFFSFFHFFSFPFPYFFFIFALFFV